MAGLQLASVGAPLSRDVNVSSVAPKAVGRASQPQQKLIAGLLGRITAVMRSHYLALHIATADKQSNIHTFIFTSAVSSTVYGANISAEWPSIIISPVSWAKLTANE
eukprot:scaffold18233_cov55-Skeletonema_dohrnii-CCMP3373.AAC.1